MKLRAIQFMSKIHKKTVVLKLLVAIIAVAVLIFINFSDPQYQTMPDIIKSPREIPLLHSFRTHSKSHDTSQTKNSLLFYPKWKLNKIIWVYKNQNLSKIQTFTTLNLLNTRHYAQLSNYTVVQINQKNYHEHLSPISIDKITTIIRLLNLRLENQKYKDYFQQIRQNHQYIVKRLIVYLILLEKGGIFIDESVTIVERLDSWLQNILNLPDINVGDKFNPYFSPQCFGFYRTQISSLKKKVNVKREFQFEKKIVQFPVFEDDFIACEKQSDFMSKLVEAYLDILFNGHDSVRMQKLNKNQNLLGRTNQWQPYKHGHLLAMHSILQQRQHLLNEKNQFINKKFAIDDFGLVTINANIALLKLRLYLGNNKQIFSFLSKFQMKHLKNITGLLRYAFKIDSTTVETFERRLNQPSTSTNFFMENSFFHFYFLQFWPSNLTFKKKPQIQPEPKQLSNANNKQWESFNKNVWVIWDKGLKGHSNLMVQICFQNLKKSAKNSGYELNLITKSNIEQYLDKWTLHKIEYALSHADFQVSQQVRTDFWRIALIYQYGGVYIDASTFTTEENFDFITNITRQDSGLIWNRFEDEPLNLIFWNAHYSHPADWHIDSKWNTKAQWQLSYENNFIAGVKGNEFMKEWFEVFSEWIVTKYDKITDQMKEVGMYNQRWTNQRNRYLLAMDSMKYVLGRREKWLKDTSNNVYHNAAHYYKLWSIPGQLIGQQKLRGQSNFQNSDYRLNWFQRACNNVYRYQYSVEHVQQILGPVSYQTKFFGGDSKELNLILERFSILHNHKLDFQVLSELIHPQSILSKLLHANPERTFEIIKYYAKLREIKTKYRSLHKVGYQI